VNHAIFADNKGQNHYSGPAMFLKHIALTRHQIGTFLQIENCHYRHYQNRYTYKSRFLVKKMPASSMRGGQE
jgi:hypothetical protein